MNAAGEPCDPLGLWGDALAAVEEARRHGYSSSAAFQAAFDHLEGADRSEALLIASLLASWIACDLNPTNSVTDLEWWVEQAMAIVARGQAKQ